jgi:hypothetical protein
MVALPDFENTTRTQIFRAYEKAREPYEQVGINVGELGGECDRALWYTFRRASPAVEIIDGRKLRIFETGIIEEGRIISNLRSTGCDVRSEQERVQFVGGHVRGKIDGEALGVVEAPKTVHLVECKSSNDKAFRDVRKNGVQKAKPLHYCQCQMYMHGRGLARALYVCVNKDDDDIYVERVPYDVEFCLRMLARAERIIKSDDPPGKISDNPSIPPCLWCRHKAVCHEDAWPRRNCRTCLYSTAVTTSKNACWDCARWNRPLTLEQQEAGCPQHRFLPGIVPGEQIDADIDTGDVTYKLKDGTVWINGDSAP